MKRIESGNEDRELKTENGGGHVSHEADLPELGVRILGDFARIVSAEARLIESTVVGVAQAFVERLYLVSIITVLAVVGVVTVIGGVMALLHTWLPWWQVFGVGGIGSLILAAVLKHTLMPSGVPFHELPRAGNR
jgi:hypothetical protein